MQEDQEPQDLIFLLEQNNCLKTENMNYKSKIDLLCPHCKALFTSTKTKKVKLNLIKLYLLALLIILYQQKIIIKRRKR